MYATISVSCANWEQARTIARRVVEERLAACVQMLPIESIYRWQGDVTSEQEILLLMKTRAALFERVSQAVRTMHSYDVPEITLTPIAEGAPSYLGWIDENVAG